MKVTFTSFDKKFSWDLGDESVENILHIIYLKNELAYDIYIDDKLHLFDEIFTEQTVSPKDIKKKLNTAIAGITKLRNESFEYKGLDMFEALNKLLSDIL